MLRPQTPLRRDNDHPAHAARQESRRLALPPIECSGSHNSKGPYLAARHVTHCPERALHHSPGSRPQGVHCATNSVRTTHSRIFPVAISLGSRSWNSAPGRNHSGGSKSPLVTDKIATVGHPRRNRSPSIVSTELIQSVPSAEKHGRRPDAGSDFIPPSSAVRNLTLTNRLSAGIVRTRRRYFGSFISCPSRSTSQ